MKFNPGKIEAVEKLKQTWMVFTTPLVSGIDLEREFKQAQQIRLCDFGSAGNTWQEGSHYPLWIEESTTYLILFLKK